ncbi:MAG: hypothetical protein ACO1RT_03285 [Planctomycetaceae bacterium]
MSKDLVSRYQKSLHLADLTRQRVEELFAKGKLRERDALLVYEGLFLRAVVGFEDLLEKIFFSILEGNSPKRAWKCRLTGQKKALRESVLNSKPYLDWLPYERTVDRANIYLVAGKPFTLVETADQNKIQQVLYIRHAIAHQSDSALLKFRTKVIGSTPLPSKERYPATFLRGISTSSTRRYEVYANSLGTIANKLQ